MHHAEAGSSPIAGIDIDVLAPETFWTVIGVPITMHRRITVVARKIFYAALESFSHRSVDSDRRGPLDNIASLRRTSKREIHYAGRCKARCRNDL